MSEPAIRLLVGLGNPGPEYQNTRHNAGFWFIDLLVHKHNIILSSTRKFYGALGRGDIDGNDVRLLKPLTFMNHSGQAVAAVARYFDISPVQILVIHDELDLSPGEVRLKCGGGHAGHNGLRDIGNALGSKDFWRLRIGIGHSVERKRVVDYVLNRPNQTQAAAMTDAIEQIFTQLPDIIAGNFAQVMNNLHRKKS